MGRAERRRLEKQKGKQVKTYNLTRSQLHNAVRQVTEEDLKRIKQEAMEDAIKAVDEYYKDTVYPDTRLGSLSRVFTLSEEDIKSSGYVVDSLEASIWCLYNSNSYTEAVLRAVNLGEDTDTIGAITGSLAGLFIGGEHLPKEWVDSLQAKDKILQIVDRFYEQYK